MQKQIVENGIRYTLGEDGLYYPDLQLPEGTDYEIGRYGRLRAENMMLWVGMVNNIRDSAEEVVLRDIVYV